MRTGKILLSAIVGTTAMTLFSYLVSASKNKNFREPVVIGKLIESLPANIPDNPAPQIAGWGLHYSIGLLFVAVYNELWKRKKIKPSLASGALLGVASGLVGITGWKAVFGVHPNPPSKNLKEYFRHLMFAHVVFGAFSSLAYKLGLKSDKGIIIKAKANDGNISVN